MEKQIEEPSSEEENPSLLERLLCMFVAPVFIMGAWWWDFGRFERKLNAFDGMFFAMAILYFLYGFGKKPFEWAARIAFVLYGFTVAWMTYILIWK